MSLNEIKIPKNMNNQKEELESKNLDHLGIIAGIIDEIGIGQRQLRIALKTQKATVKNQLNKPTESPTLRWIFQCFQGIHFLVIQGVHRILNLTESHCRILQFLPNACQKYYLLC